MRWSAQPSAGRRIGRPSRATRARCARRSPRNTPARIRWDLKYAPGGLIDIEFLAQTLQLRHAHEKPAVLSTNTIDALKRLSTARALGESDAAALIAAAAFSMR